MLGIGLIAYSLVTDYERGAWKLAPMAVHNLIDVVAGILLRGVSVALRLRRRERKRLGPYLVVGLAAVFLGLTTRRAATATARSATPATR